MPVKKPTDKKEPVQTITSLKGFEETIETETIEVQREKTAKWLSYIVIGVFAVTIIATIVALIWVHYSRLTNLLEFIKVILPAETALLGTIFGFYFSQSRLQGKE